MAEGVFGLIRSTTVSASVPSKSFPPGTPAEDVEPASEAQAGVFAEDQRVPLRLAASRGALALELYEPVGMGPLSVSALSVTLPGLRFPLDLSGGVPKFRHRRGQLEHLALETDLDRLERWAAPRLREVLDESVRPAVLWLVPGGIGVGLVGRRQALAFDVLWAPDAATARFVLANARGVGLTVPALAVALRAVDTLLGRLAERRGRVLRVERAPQVVSRLLLPAVGARAPSTDRVRFVELTAADRRVRAVLDVTEPAAELHPDAVRALELGELVASSDDELAQGDSDKARLGYVTALERAPRNPEIVRLIAEIDTSVDGRTEAALGLLVETLPATQAGLIGAELLFRSGDVTGAREAVEQSVAREPFAPLAALGWLRWAELEPEPFARSFALDRAVAQAPGLVEPRWARFSARVERGDVAGALADAEHLEALEQGARHRHERVKRAARRLLDAGYVVEAGRLFERALRYLPDDAAATAGLARALLQSRRTRRALSLFERAVALSDRDGSIDAEALLDLAKILADELHDLPHAIARVRQVTVASGKLVEARHLEAVWRARLGDRSGATLAFARLRESIELSDVARPEWVTYLRDAAENALIVDEDPTQAERHLAVALRAAPGDASLGAWYREIAARIAERRSEQR